MDKLVRMASGIILLFGIISCGEKEVDGEYALGIVNYTIVNGTKHKCVIESYPIHNSKELICEEIASGDSVIYHKNGEGSYSTMYDLYNDKVVYLVFDDSVKYDCLLNKDHEMIALDRNYKLNVISEYPNYHYEFRYVITEEDYEYAKLHPYKEE